MKRIRKKKQCPVMVSESTLEMAKSFKDFFGFRSMDEAVSFSLAMAVSEWARRQEFELKKVE